MVTRKSIARFGLMLSLSLRGGPLGAVGRLRGEDTSNRAQTDRDSLPRPVYKVANRVEGETARHRSGRRPAGCAGCSPGASARTGPADGLQSR